MQDTFFKKVSSLRYITDFQRDSRENSFLYCKGYIQGIKATEYNTLYALEHQICEYVDPLFL